MTTASNLPPLPESFRHFPKVERDMMQAYALAAYQAGRNAGLEEAAKVPRRYAEQLDTSGWGNRFPNELTSIFNASTNMAGKIRALKSDAKGGV